MLDTLSRWRRPAGVSCPVSRRSSAAVRFAVMIGHHAGGVITAESLGSRPGGMPSPARGRRVSTARAAGGRDKGRPKAGPKGRAAPLTRMASGAVSAGWPRQRPVHGRVQGPGRGAEGEAVPTPGAVRSKAGQRTASGDRVLVVLGLPVFVVLVLRLARGSCLLCGLRHCCLLIRGMLLVGGGPVGRRPVSSAMQCDGHDQVGVVSAKAH